MPATKAKPKKTSPLVWIGGAALLAVIYVYTSGDDTTTPTKAATTAKKAASSSTDNYTPEDYKASYPELKIVAKNAFLPLIRKADLSSTANGKGSLPNAISGGGDWSYDGMVSVDNRTQGLLDEVKTGESDFVTVGEHWKHGRIRKITDGEIEIAGDDGTVATMKVGETPETAPKDATTPAVAPLDPQMNGPIGSVDITALPPTNFGNNNGGNGGFGRGRGNRRGRGGMGFFGGGGG